ncbi:MAG: hypothetical protein JOY58_16110 [Solirubrobacterales bacterium]|nr:hypothetical protein [Solirubrobacterales bacterium]
MALAERMRPGSVLDPRSVVHRSFQFARAPDLALLGAVLDEVVARHDAARTLPRKAGDMIELVPAPTRRVIMEERELTSVADEAELRRAIDAVAYAPFDLETGPLVRGSWVRRGAGGILVLTLHHWAGDAGALDALQHEVAALYTARRAGRPMPPEPPRYVDVARGKRVAPAALDEQETLAWWRAQLAGARRASLPTGAKASGPVTGGPRAGPSARVAGAGTALVSAPLGAAADAALVRLAVEHRASPYMVLLAALSAILDDGRGGAEADLTVFAVDGARDGAARRVLGFLAQPMALRFWVDRRAPLGSAVCATRAAVLDALDHRDVPFARLLQIAPRLAVGLLRGRRPATVVQYFALRPLDLDGLRGVPLSSFTADPIGEAQPSPIPIALDVTFERRGDAHTGAAFYDAAHWSAGEVTEALATVQRVLAGAAADPWRPLGELNGQAR